MTVYITIWGFMLAAGLSAIWALAWTIRRGHLRQMQAQARSIFDAQDPVPCADPPRGLSTSGE